MSGNGWTLKQYIDADSFLMYALKLGKPSEVSLVGAFDSTDRGSRKDEDLPLHFDGDYSRRKAAERGEVFDKVIDYVCIYCLIGNETTITLVEDDTGVTEVHLKPGDGLIMDNRKVRHGRRGAVGSQVLLRVWIEEVK